MGKTRQNQPRSGPRKEQEPKDPQRVAQLTLEDRAPETPDRVGRDNQAHARARAPGSKAEPGDRHTASQEGEAERRPGAGGWLRGRPAAFPKTPEPGCLSPASFISHQLAPVAPASRGGLRPHNARGTPQVPHLVCDEEARLHAHRDDAGRCGEVGAHVP